MTASSQLPGQIGQEQIVFQGFRCGISCDMYKLDVHHPGPIPHLFSGDVIAQHGVVSPTGGNPALHPGC